MNAIELLTLSRSHVDALRNYRVPAKPVGTIEVLDRLIAEVERLRAALQRATSQQLAAVEIVLRFVNAQKPCPFYGEPDCGEWDDWFRLCADAGAFAKAIRLAAANDAARDAEESQCT